MYLNNQNIESLRSLSQILSPSAFKRIIRLNDNRQVLARIKKHGTNFKLLSNASNFGLFLKGLYKTLQNNYRNEYIYKNAIINKLLIHKFGVKNTSVLNEFRIAKSIADLILINGTVKIYEIKSDLDNMDKLNRQINDYQKAIEKIYIISSPNYTKRILDSYKTTNIGVLELERSDKIIIRKEARIDKSKFEYETIFKMLRRNEYLNVVQKFYGNVPNVPNTKIFKECLSLTKQLNIQEFQRAAFIELKKRKLSCANLFESNKTPYELKSICYTIDLNKNEYETLFNLLKNQI